MCSLRLESPLLLFLHPYTNKNLCIIVLATHNMNVNNSTISYLRLGRQAGDLACGGSGARKLSRNSLKDEAACYSEPRAFRAEGLRFRVEG